MKVTIAIPTRDRRRYLEQSLRSAQAQTHPDLEVSWSRTTGRLTGPRTSFESVADVDPRVRLATDNPTPGAFANIRHLIDEATGDAIAVLGDDDLLEPSYVSRLAMGMLDPSVSAAFCRHDVIDANGHPKPAQDGTGRTRASIRRDTGRQTGRPRPAGPARPDVFGSCLFRTTVLRATAFDPACGSAADWDLAIRIVSGGTSYFVPDVLWHYRDHAASLSRGRDIGRRRDAVTVLEKHAFDDPGLEALRLSLLRRRLAGLALAVAIEEPRGDGPGALGVPSRRGQASFQAVSRGRRLPMAPTRHRRAAAPDVRRIPRGVTSPHQRLSVR